MSSSRTLGLLESPTLGGLVAGAAVAFLLLVLLLGSCLYRGQQDPDVQRGRPAARRHRVRWAQPRLFPGRGHQGHLHRFHQPGHVSHVHHAGLQHHQRLHQAHRGHH